MMLAGHDVQQWCAVIAGAGAAFYTVVRLTRSAWKFFWRVTKAVVGEVVEPAFDKVNANVDVLRHYTEYHLGPNDGTTPVHTRIERIERDNEVIKSRQVSQHRENTKTLGEVVESVKATSDHPATDLHDPLSDP